MHIDTRFDVREDSGGRDPDAYSRTLRRYHQLLWSKKLPDGRNLELRDTAQSAPKGYDLYAVLEDESVQTWGSDSFLASHTTWIKGGMDKIMAQVSETVKEDFRKVGSTVGGFILWPQNRVDRKWTINQARGCTAKIADRMDLTLECVRRFYLDPEDASPLGVAFGRYPEFFALFRDFRGYVDFWLLQDLVSPDYSQINFYLPFDEFDIPIARSVDEWNTYRRNSIAFCNARNRRIEQWALENLGD
ncbi:MAG: hypothetical protein JHD02_03700 [Thermoleophilaceae bacterium]|nr:hypothetical protein [Thermoleophilaceae bacterium]